MIKQTLYYIYKINSSRLRKNNWSLNLSIEEAMKTEQIVPLSDSQAIDFIKSINNSGINIDKYTVIHKIRENILKIHKLPTSKENKLKIKELYKEWYKTLFIKDYITVVMDNKKDFDRTTSKKGIYVNGVKFKRLLATPAGAKKSTIIFISEIIYNKLYKKTENNRDADLPLVPAKLEAYKALICSSSIKVSNPKGLLVVKDCETNFLSDIIKIDDSESNNPIVTYEKDYPIKLNANDGYGLICPKLSEEWTNELGKDYISTGFCIRNSFCKGMLFTFDFHDFAKNVAKNNMVKDVWGDMIDISKVEIVLTASMLKLWSTYEDVDDYINCCNSNGYTFRVTKMISNQLEDERFLNYQFIQSLHMNNTDIEELIKPSVNEIKDILCGDYRKSILFLKGIGVSENDLYDLENDCVKALMINENMINDPFVIDKINHMIQKRINDSKMGVLKIKGNFSTISGDPFSLCQSIFAMKVTGLLGKGEFYSKYWLDKGVNKVACFRAPMTCHNNIRILDLVKNKQIEHWYKYMTCCTIFNAWDTTTHALNGADMDADAILTTNNKAILNSIIETPAIVCTQKVIKPKIVTESDLKKVNKNTFGDEIGFTTNIVSSMIDLRANFTEDSEEYKELTYRITCGQHYQQNAIDKAKGIVCKSMPKEWYNLRSNKILDTDSIDEQEKKKLNIRIVANKKPYYFIYNYPSLMKKYNKFIKQTNSNSIRRFGINIKNLIAKESKTNEENLFLFYYNLKLPVFNYDSVMNKICWRIENEFDNWKIKLKGLPFNYKILMTNTTYSKSRYNEVKGLYKDFVNKSRDFMQLTNSYKISKEDKKINRMILKESFKNRAFEICSNKEELCNILVDLCYKNKNSKQFVWDIVGDQIIDNLLKSNDYKISLPIKSKNGNFEFCGDKFMMKTVTMEGGMVI